MKQNTSNSAKKGARRGAGQAVAAMVMALAVAVGGVGTTALLAAQPVGLTVEPSTIQWEDDSTQTSTNQNQKKQEQKKPTVKAESEAATEQPAEPKAESTAASVEEKAESAAPSVSEAASSEAAPSEPAQEPAPADPMAGEGTGLEQENAFPVFQQETDELAAEDPLSPRVENTAMDGAADTAVSTAGVNSVEDALAEAQIKDENGTILLTPEEIRAALDAGTLDEDSIDAQCLADENGLLSWLWKWLFGKKEDNTPAPVYSGWRTVNGKTYYLLFSLNALDEMQDRFGGYDKLDKAFDQSNPTMIKDLRWLLTLIINEGMEEGETPLTEQQVGKLIHIGNLPQIKDAIFSAFVYSTNGGEEKEAADGEADTTEEGNRVAVQDE